MKTVGFENLFRGLDDLEDDSIEGLYEGLQDGAELYEQGMKETTAYQGMSGATRTSSVAYVVSPNRNDFAKIEQAHAAAVALLSNFSGHEGKPMLEDRPDPGNDSLMVVGTVPTTYQAKLETLNAGAKAFVGPELDKTAGQIFEAANNGVRRRLRR